MTYVFHGAVGVKWVDDGNWILKKWVELLSGAAHRIFYVATSSILFYFIDGAEVEGDP